MTNRIHTRLRMYGLSSPGMAMTLLGTCLAFSIGCGGSYELHPLSGSVTFEGQPVPIGRLVFVPDEEAGNRGPRTEADVKDGQYQTPPNGGIIGGKYIVEVDGFEADPRDEEELVRLFPLRQIKVDLPAGGGTHDFELTTE